MARAKGDDGPEDDPLSNTMMPPSERDALDLERQRLELERERLKLDRERLELEKLGSGSRKATPAPGRVSDSKLKARPRARGPSPGAPPAAGGFPWPVAFGFVAVALVITVGAFLMQGSRETPAPPSPSTPSTEEVAALPSPTAIVRATPAPVATPREEPVATPTPREVAPPPIEATPEPRASTTAEATPEAAPAPTPKPEAAPVSTAALAAKKKAREASEKALTARLTLWLDARRNIECSGCKGKIVLRCENCHGTGTVTEVKSQEGEETHVCASCRGKGRVFCAFCHKTGLSDNTVGTIEKKFRACGTWIFSSSLVGLKIDMSDDGRHAVARYLVRVQSAHRDTPEASDWELDDKGAWQTNGIVVEEPKGKK